MGHKRLGLIGNPLAHSWSPEIHRFLISADYKLWELEEDELEEFFRRRDFDGINVTIPYKSTVIQYLNEVDETAERIGAVNCIINRDGKLKGYNTDIAGLMLLAETNGADPGSGRAAIGETAILGSGGASKAAAEVCRLKGWPYHIVSRKPDGISISYEDLWQMRDRVTLIINATPIGMFPDMKEMPVDPADFPALKYVIDIVANPVRTSLVYEAECLGINACGGLGMLIGQALAADELFCDCTLDAGLIDKCRDELLRERQNIVLIGMPSAGKTTIGRLLAKRLGREFCDMDELIVRRTGMQISEYFARNGEAAFRKIESDICRALQERQGIVIASGGGVVKDSDNMRALAHSGLIVWLDRDLSKLTPTDSRPLSSNMDDLLRLYEERRTLYAKWSDIRIDNAGSPEETADRILTYLR